MNTYRQRFKTVEQRFLEKVNKNGPIPAHMPHLGPCWIWTGTHQTRNGKPWYGLFWLDGANPGAHRISHEINKGPIGDKHICHHCDNPQCVRPDHLFLGTHQDNMDDCVKKGRPRIKPPISVYHRGEQCKRSTLKDVQVLEIKNLYAAGVKPRHIVAQTGVGGVKVRSIIYGQSWKHIKSDYLAPGLSQEHSLA